VQTNFTSWQKFTIGDFTARIFQFKLRLISNSPSVTPRVFDAKIKADMPDRIISGENISAPDTGYRVDFEPFFKGPTPSPSIGITQDNASQGDYYTITNKSTLGFDIQFYDKDNIAVARTFDYQAKGFGKSNFEVVDS
jgi:hypothetical protein